MPTLLTNSKMEPVLRKRIEASLSVPSGDRSMRARRPAAVALLRVVVVCGVLGILIGLVVTYRASRQELAAERQRLVERFRGEERLLGAEERVRLGQLEPLVERVVRAAPGDFEPELVAEAWSNPEQRRALLTRRAFYGRGDLEPLRDTKRRAERFAETGVDAFAACWFEPPESDKESALLRRIGVRAPGDRVVPVGYAAALLEYSAASWEERAARVEHLRPLHELEAAFERARIGESVRRVEGVRLLLVVVDEPKEAGAKSDFDGEARHFVRVALYDLDTGEAVLWLRRFVDPAWISDKSRLQYSRPLDACKLAREVHALPASP